MSTNDIITRTTLIAVILSLVSIHAVQAVSGTYKDAMEVRQLLSVSEADFQKICDAKARTSGVGETIVLPVSRGFTQRGTSLCWAYATLNALETIHLVQDPNGLDVELSRRAMQYYTWEDRYRRSIKGVNTYLREGGVVLDALRLIQANGIVAFDDHTDIADAYGQADISSLIDNAETVTEKMIAMYEGIGTVYTAPPTVTHIPNSLPADDPSAAYLEAPPGELAELVLGDYLWESYTPSETETGYHDHPDADARWENQSWYMPRDEFPGRIKQALQAGFPVLISIRNHSILLYGAEYDENGDPVVYYIKDSYPDYYYLSDANYLYENFWEMATVKL